jgi:glycosyltransferase involved in cell wall biosynthesis
MKITIVCGHFIPAMGYIEVHLARAFAEMGHDVTVVTSTEIPPYIAHLHQEFGEAPKGVKVIRLKPKFTLGQVVIATRVKEAVLASSPDQIIVIGLGKAFPKPALGIDVHTTALFGDNSASYGDSPSVKTRLLFEIFKRGTYQKAIEKADRLVAYTPESFEAAGRMLGGKWAKKLTDQKDFISLGYHPNEFFFDADLRKKKRTELGFTDQDRVVVTATRIRPEKKLEQAIPALERTPNAKWLLIGSAEDDYANQLREELENRIGSDKFLFLPHAHRDELNGFYNAADLALFTTPAISIIEAMGTGLPVVLPNEKSLSHLINEGNQGCLVEDFDDPLLKSISISSRSVLNEKNSLLFSWTRQAKQLLFSR